MNNYDSTYLKLINEVVSNGQRKDDRTGVGTYSLFGQQMRMDMREGFPLLTTKAIYFTGVKHELLWFLQGGHNIKYLVDNNVNIWNEWPHQEYCKLRNRYILESTMLTTRLEIETKGDIDNTNFDFVVQRMSHVDEWLVDHPPLTLPEFVEKVKTDPAFAYVWGSLGPVYGKQWVDWRAPDGSSVNQIAQVIDQLKNNPDSRRIMVNAWNVGEIDQMILPPCHYGFQFWTRPVEGGKRTLSLAFNMRSVDMFLGMPFDIASYGLLLSMVAQCVDMTPEELIVFSGDTHVYVNHLEQVKEQTSRENKFKLPKLWLNPEVKDIFEFKSEDIEIQNYERYPAIKASVAV